MAETKPDAAPPPGLRFQVGVAFFVLGWVAPLFIPLVAATDLSVEWKTTISGLLVLGGPELCSLICVALLGKSGFLYLKTKVFALLKRAAPPARVSRMRYRLGVSIWVFMFVYGSTVYYAPELIPGYDEHRLVMNLSSDLLFVASFFILGGDFWDKFRALFLYEAKAVMPEH